jgi:hypothetical protein
VADYPTVGELVAEMRERSRQLDSALDFLKTVTVQAAEAEHDYRKERSLRFLAAEGSAAVREVVADSAAVHLRKARDIAEGMKMAALEAVRSRRAQLSEFARTGP